MIFLLLHSDKTNYNSMFVIIDYENSLIFVFVPSISLTLVEAP